MKRKLNRIIIIITVVIVACVGGLVIFLTTKNADNKPNDPTETPVELVSEETLRTFSTSPDSYNVITRYGNTKTYFKNEYSTLYATTDRQSTGIAAMSGDTIKVYVEAEEGDPLPSICFTQYVSLNTNWMKTFQLSIGENEFTVPEFGFYNDATTYYYSRVDEKDIYKTLYHGGPIYLINQYTENEQSSNVKITISGGECFPVFKDGGNEKIYKAQLKSYVEKVNAHPEKYIDVTEIEMQHNLMTVWATRCYNEAYSGNVSVQVNVNLWNDYMERLLAFNGAEFDENSTNYNPLVEHVRINIRQAQPSIKGASLYAIDEYVGWFNNAGTSCFNFVYNNDLTHEIGHIVDVNGRNINEVTNEVVCEWGGYIYVGGKSSSVAIQEIFSSSTNETALSKNWYTYQTYGKYKMLWFLPCGSDTNIWGKFNNLYKTEETGKTLSYVEKMVYYWSLASGVDSSEYFERLGFYYKLTTYSEPVFNSTSSRFTYEKASEEFKTLMSTAKSAGRIGEAKKWWYYDVTQFNLIHDYGSNISSWGSLYTSENKIEIKNIFKTSNGYMLLMPEPTNSTAHLGYEILEYNGGKWSVIGFTYNSQFEDTTTYEDGYTPTYKIRAYDRMLNCTSASDEKKYVSSVTENVCKIGDTYYTSLSEAISQAEAGSTIYISKDTFASNITINKNLTILAEVPVTITKDCPGNMFTVTSGTVTFGDSQNLLTLDGGGFTQMGTLIYCSSNAATVNVNNAMLRNNHNSGNGGAILLESLSKVNISNCEIYDNSASNGGGICNNGSTATIKSTKIYSNTATSNGGGIGNINGAVLTATSCLISTNKSVYGGGVANSASATLTNCTITGNSATFGGGIHLVPNTYNRTMSISSGSITGNFATSGGNLAYVGAVNSIIGILNFTTSTTVLSGEILKSTKSSVNFSAGILDLANVTFAFDDFADNATVGTCSNLTKEQLSQFNISHDGQVTNNGNNVIFNFSGVQLNVKYSYTVNVKTLSLRVNENYVLPATLSGMAESVYIKEYRAADGSVYKIGDTVNINDISNTLIAVVAKKCRVTVTYADHTETLYLKSGENLNLGSLYNDQDEASISKWYVDGETKDLDSIIQITKDTYITALQ